MNIMYKSLPDYEAQLYYKAQSHYGTKSDITERIKFSYPEDQKTMHEFLPLLWNERKQPSTLNNYTSVHSNKVIVINIFEGKKFMRQKPTLWYKPDIWIFFFFIQTDCFG